jgi:hypothetical protein
MILTARGELTTGAGAQFTLHEEMAGFGPC